MSLGPDWFLLLLQGHLHPSTTVLALKLLLLFLSSPSLRAQFKDGLSVGSWVEHSAEGVATMMGECGHLLLLRYEDATGPVQHPAAGPPGLLPDGSRSALASGLLGGTSASMLCAPECCSPAFLGSPFDRMPHKDQNFPTGLCYLCATGFMVRVSLGSSRRGGTCPRQDTSVSSLSLSSCPLQCCSLSTGVCVLPLTHPFHTLCASVSKLPDTKLPACFPGGWHLVHICL